MSIQQQEIIFAAFEQEVIDPLRGIALTDEERMVANLLLDATGEKPMSGKEIRARLHEHFGRPFSQRRVMQIIRRLRKDRAFPILATRTQPSGYWWCTSEEQMKEFYENFRAVALDEMDTAAKMIRANYPRLAGQLRLDLEKN